jgi:hypothetical protein
MVAKAILEIPELLDQKVQQEPPVRLDLPVPPDLAEVAERSYQDPRKILAPLEAPE